jgi:hypothetical protein
MLSLVGSREPATSTPYLALCPPVDQGHGARSPIHAAQDLQPAVCGGAVTSKWSAGQYDLCTFTPSFEDGIDPPESYGGVSGGGLWRIYFEPDGSKQGA